MSNCSHADRLACFLFSPMLFLPVLVGDHGTPRLTLDAALGDGYCPLVAASFANDAVSNIVYGLTREERRLEPCEARAALAGEEK